MTTIVTKYVELCVFRFEAGESRYLLLRRSKEEKYYPDTWQLVTGSIEGNEGPLQAARRELAEETGLEPTGFWVVPFVNSFYTPEYDTISLNPVFAAQVSPAGVPVLSGEHREWRWYTAEEALRLLVWPGQQQALKLVQEFIVGGKEAMKLSKLE